MTLSLLSFTASVKDPSDKCVDETDVLVVLTGMDAYKNMNCLPFTEFYRQLTRKETGFRVNIYHSSFTDRFDPCRQGLLMMHVRAVAGVEKKVVVFLPCRQHQAKQLQMTYADAVRRQPTVSQRTNVQTADFLGGREQTQSTVDNSYRNTAQESERCQHITSDQRQKLDCLGVLNLHWLWYAASRCLSHLIIFHF